ncbi:MAG: DUF3617 domain-containing protein [Betaproteobacteria bacterium]
MRLFLLLAFLVLSTASRADLEPGNWELTATTQVPGSDKPMTLAPTTRCVTAEDAKDPSRLLGQSGRACEFSNRRDSGSALSFDVACKGQVPMKGSGSVRYGKDTFEGNLDLTAEGVVIGGQALVMKSRISGRRLGPCA